MKIDYMKTFYYSYMKPNLVETSTKNVDRIKNLGQVSFRSGLWETTKDGSHNVPSDDLISDCEMKLAPDFFSFLKKQTS